MKQCFVFSLLFLTVMWVFDFLLPKCFSLNGKRFPLIVKSVHAIVKSPLYEMRLMDDFQTLC